MREGGRWRGKEERGSEGSNEVKGRREGRGEGGGWGWK